MQHWLPWVGSRSEAAGAVVLVRPELRRGVGGLQVGWPALAPGPPAETSFTVFIPVLLGDGLSRGLFMALGTWLGSSVSKNETHEHGEISTRLFTSTEGHRYSKKRMHPTKDPPLFIPNAGDVPLPFP